MSAHYPSFMVRKIMFHNVSKVSFKTKHYCFETTLQVENSY